MRKPQLRALSKSFDALLAEKRSLAHKEEQVMLRLNKVLQQLGYRVERSEPTRSRSGKSPKRAVRRQLKADNAIDRPSQEAAGRRRGRPPLRRVA